MGEELRKNRQQLSPGGRGEKVTQLLPRAGLWLRGQEEEQAVRGWLLEGVNKKQQNKKAEV